MAFDTSSALSGAGTGAIYGSTFGIPGALAGAAIGGAAGGFFGGKKSPATLSTLDPRQRKLMEQYTQALEGGGGPLSDVYGQFNPETMRNVYESAYAQPAYQEFQQNIVPTITGQFRGQNLQNSSYLGGALSKAGTDVQNNLNGQMAKLLYQGQQDSLRRRSGAVENILGNQTFAYQKPQPSIFDNLLESLTAGSGSMLADILDERKRNRPNSAASPGMSAPVGG